MDGNWQNTATKLQEYTTVRRRRTTRIAVGATHGNSSTRLSTLKGSNNRATAQTKYFSSNRTPNSTSTQFVSERELLVMVRLAFDVFDHCVFVIVRHGKRTVTILPMREFRKHGVVFDPRAGADLNIFDQVREGNSWVQACQNVNVVFHAANAIEVTIFVFQYAPGVTEKVFPFVRAQCRHAIFC